MCVYIYTICIFLFVYVKHINMCTHMFGFVYKCVYIYMYMCVCTWVYVYVYTRMYTYIYMGPPLGVLIKMKMTVYGISDCWKLPHAYVRREGREGERDKQTEREFQ